MKGPTNFHTRHIYDQLFSAAVTPGGQSFQRRQQWLQQTM